MREMGMVVGFAALSVVAVASMGFMTTGCGGVMGGDGGCPGAIIVSCTEPCPIDCEAEGGTEVCVGPDFFDDPGFGENERCCFCE